MAAIDLLADAARAPRGAAEAADPLRSDVPSPGRAPPRSQLHIDGPGTPVTQSPPDRRRSWPDSPARDGTIRRYLTGRACPYKRHPQPVAEPITAAIQPGAWRHGDHQRASWLGFRRP